MLPPCTSASTHNAPNNSVTIPIGVRNRVLNAVSPRTTQPRLIPHDRRSPPAATMASSANTIPPTSRPLARPAS